MNVFIYGFITIFIIGIYIYGDYNYKSIRKDALGRLAEVQKRLNKARKH